MANKLLKGVFVLACISTLSACGHIGKAISNEDALLDKAEFATGIDRKYLSVIPGSIQAQIDSVHYKVKSKKGGYYRCYYTTVVAVTSDAICKRIGATEAKQNVKANAKKKESDSCNALLRAAGRC